METKVSYSLVGFFVIALGAAAMALLLWLAAGTDDKAYATYQVYVSESVAGLNPKAAVRYRGVDVGQVADIRLDPEDPRRVQLTLNIDARTPIREDTLATLSIQGLTGLATVELSGGSPRSPPLTAPPDELYPVIQSAPSLVKRLDDAFSDAVAEFDRLSTRVDLLLNADNISAIGATLANVSRVSAALANRADAIERTLDNLETASAVLADEGTALAQAFARAAQTLDRTLTDIADASAELPLLIARLGSAAGAAEQMAGSLTQTSATMNRAVADSRDDLRRLVQRTGPEFDATLRELNRLSNSIQRFVNELERNPQMLLLGKPDPAPGPGE